MQLKFNSYILPRGEGVLGLRRLYIALARTPRRRVLAASWFLRRAASVWDARTRGDMHARHGHAWARPRTARARVGTPARRVLNC
jgi:hypothetical protein